MKNKKKNKQLPLRDNEWTERKRSSVVNMQDIETRMKGF